MRLKTFEYKVKELVIQLRFKELELKGAGAVDTVVAEDQRSTSVNT